MTTKSDFVISIADGWILVTAVAAVVQVRNGLCALCRSDAPPPIDFKGGIQIGNGNSAVNSNAGNLYARAINSSETCYISVDED